MSDVCTLCVCACCVPWLLSFRQFIIYNSQRVHIYLVDVVLECVPSGRNGVCPQIYQSTTSLNSHSTRTRRPVRRRTTRTNLRRRTVSTTRQSQSAVGHICSASPAQSRVVGIATRKPSAVYGDRRGVEQSLTTTSRAARSHGQSRGAPHPQPPTDGAR